MPSTSLPLGVDTKDLFTEQCIKLDFNDDDRLIFWTDGIYDTQNHLGERFSQTLLADIFENCQPGYEVNLFDNLLLLVKNHIGDDHSSDDVSLVEVLTCQPNASIEVATQSKTSKGPVDWQLEFEIKAPTFQSFDPVPALMNLLSQFPGLGARATSLFTVLSELYTNALDHGLLGLSSIQKSCDSSFDDYYQQRENRLANLSSGYIKFYLRLTTRNTTGRLEVKVEDSGPGFDFTCKSPLSDDQLLHGRGIDLVRQFCQSLTYEGRGNIAKAIYVWSLDNY